MNVMEKEYFRWLFNEVRTVCEMDDAESKEEKLEKLYHDLLDEVDNVRNGTGVSD